MNSKLITILLSLLCGPATFARVLTVDSCRAMALKGNKQMQVSQVKQDVAANLRRSAWTKFLPHVSAVGTYQYTSRPISLLNDAQKQALPQIGTNLGSSLGSQLAGVMGSAISPAAAQMLASLGIDLNALQQGLGQGMGNISTLLDAQGQSIVDALDTDTRHIWAGTIMAVQPVFMGGSIVALHKMAKLNELLQQQTAEATRQSVVYTVDQAYWQVVSLHAKQQLAESYVKVLERLDGDVQKMIREGVATRSDGLSVSVKLNEARLTQQKVENGLQLSRMLLCQLVGLPLDEDIQLADEEQLTVEENLQVIAVDKNIGVEGRPELKALETSVDMSRQVVNILKAGNLPQVALMGGYATSNPNLLNGFEKKFGGFWNIGVLLRVPLWNWGDVTYKVRAAKGANTIARLEMDELREKMELQLEQSRLQLDEANKRLITATNSQEKAEENLRMANLGHKEGVIATSTVMEAQTGWLQAKSAVIDARIDCIMSHENWKKAVGSL